MLTTKSTPFFFDESKVSSSVASPMNKVKENLPNCCLFYLFLLFFLISPIFPLFLILSAPFSQVLAISLFQGGHSASLAPPPHQLHTEGEVLHHVHLEEREFTVL